jgi:hypothetical protein
MNNTCKKCGKKIFYATICPYCGTVQAKLSNLISVKVSRFCDRKTAEGFRVDPVYRVTQDDYPTTTYVMHRQVVRVLSENDKACGFSPITWHDKIDLHTRILKTAVRKAKKLLQEKYPEGFTLLIGDEND